VATQTLAADQAHVWFVRPETIPRHEFERRYEFLLTPEELARGRRFRFEGRRFEYLVTRALVRTVLSQYVDVAPEDWRFGTQPLGRPQVVSPKLATTPQFSLSHADGMIVCLVANDGDVGVDVENVRRRVQFLQIAERYFSPDEATEINALPASAGRRRFFEYWTLKESITKALGSQITSGLTRFCFEPDADPIRVRFDETLSEDPAAWQFLLRRIDPDHLLAASFRTGNGRPLRINVRETVPLA
jgi:4'-phosphopantetheinyl transferase